MKSFYIDKEITAELLTELSAFAEEVERIGEPEVTFYFNSNGGAVTAGMGMYDIISSMTAKTTAKIIGVCASAATYPALACSRVEMAKNATFMIHNVSGGLYGTIEEIKKDLDYMDDLESRMLCIYAAKASISLEEIKALVDATSYLTAQQALDYGFVDYVEGLEKSPTPELPEGAAPETEKDEQEECENEGFINKVLDIVGLKSKGEIIKRPEEDIDIKNKLGEITAELEAKNTELENIRNMFEIKEQELAAQKLEHENTINKIKDEYENKLAELENTIKAEVHNRIAAIGIDNNDLPAPIPATTNINIAETVKNSGLEAALRSI